MDMDGGNADDDCRLAGGRRGQRLSAGGDIRGIRVVDGARYWMGGLVVGVQHGVGAGVIAPGLNAWRKV